MGDPALFSLTVLMPWRAFIDWDEYQEASSRQRAAGYVLFDNVDRAHLDVIDVLKFRESKAFECTHLKF